MDVFATTTKHSMRLKGYNLSKYVFVDKKGTADFTEGVVWQGAQ